MQKSLILKTGNSPITSLESCGTLLATGELDSSIRVFELLDGEKPRLKKGIKGFLNDSVNEEDTMISCLKFSDSILYASCGTSIYTFDLKSPNLILREAKSVLSHPSISEEINQFVFSDSSQSPTLAIASDSGSASIFKINEDDTLTLISEIVHENICSGIALKLNSVWSLGMMEYSLKRSKDGHVLNSILYSDSQAAQMNPPFGNCIEFTDCGNLCAIGRGDGRVSVLRFADNSDGDLAIQNEYLLVDEEVHSWSICAL
jgi:hypothetical protein